MIVDGARALAWRLRQHGLGQEGASGVVDVAERVLATRGWPPDGTELSFAVRQQSPPAGTVEDALEAGDVIRAYAFRGGSYVMTPEIARTLLAVRTATRLWETQRWQAQGEFEIEDWEPFRSAVRSAVADGPATRAEIAAHLGRTASLRHLATVAATGAGSDSIYKPLHWWGDLCFGPDREGQSTFRLLEPEPRPMTPDVDGAGRLAVAQYLLAYGPATTENLAYWLTEGLGVPRRRVLDWLADLGDKVTEVRIGDVTCYAATETIEAIEGTDPSDDVVLLPGFDPWVMGPGTADARLVPPARRALLSAGRNAVVHGGVVVGTWKLRGDVVSLAWFEEAGAAPRAALDAAVERLGAADGRVSSLGLAE